MGYVGRFAPSPTGPLHLGSLVAALGSFLEARKHGGRWLLRIEDLDSARVQPGCADEIQRTLENLGFTWDGEVQFQSRRTPLYAEALRDLQSGGHTFECHCTRRILGQNEETGYPGTCRNRPTEPGPAAVRFRVDESVSVSFTDAFQGPRSFAMRALGDVVVRRRDGIFAYQLAVVVDDADQRVSDVVRGADLLASTPWQLLIQRALRLPAPRYAHLPVVVEPDGSKLAKSRRSVPLDPKEGSGGLVDALELLGQSPPQALRGEACAAILSWACLHWDAAAVARVKKATIAPIAP